MESKQAVGSATARLTTAKGPRSLDGLSTFFERLNDVYKSADALRFTYQTHGESAEERLFLMAMRRPRMMGRPRVTYVSMQSPLIVEIAVASAPSLWFLKWLITHSEDVGGAIPSAVKGWRREWKAMKHVEHQCEELNREAGGEVQVEIES